MEPSGPSGSRKLPSNYIYSAWVPPQPSMSRPRPTANPLTYPVATGLPTRTPSHLSYQYGSSAIYASGNKDFSGTAFHSQAPSRQPGLPEQPPRNWYPYLPPTIPAPHPYYLPPSSVPQYPVQSSYPPSAMNQFPSTIDSVRSSQSQQLLNSQSYSIKGASSHLANQHPTQPRHPVPQRIHSRTPSPPHAAPAAHHPRHPSTGQPSTQHFHQQSQQSGSREGFFTGAQNIVMNNPVLNDNSNAVNLMTKLLKETIPGAAFDSSARDPPPRCHPETRLAIVEQTQRFIDHCDGRKKVLWIVGPAGVGKSAIMQTTAETTSASNTNVILGASIFFSIKGRGDGSKAITTLAYQFAVKHPPYRQFIQTEMTSDPSLLQKSMTVQFTKFIVEPFIHRLPNPDRRRFLILIDGLDECDSQETQCKLLSLISDFCISYPTSPLVWVIASRPEPHITSFFSRAQVVPAYERENVEVDSTQSCEDVERFLRDELKAIQMKSPALQDLPQWPMERDFLKLAYASKGLFAFASTVVKFIADPAYGSPVLQLAQVLEIIGTKSKWLVKDKSHPMAFLDALYNRILSRIPADVMIDTRKLLLLMMNHTRSRRFIGMSGSCSWLGMTKDIAYGATYHLRSVLDVPAPDEADVEWLECFHKSFTDYLKDFERSKFCSDIDGATDELNALCVRRVLEEAPNGMLEHGSGTVANISLSWPYEEQLKNNSARFKAYCYATDQTVWGLTENRPAFQNTFFIRALTSFDQSVLRNDFPQLLFKKSRRSEFMEHNVLKQIPIGILDICNVPMKSFVNYEFKCSATIMATLPDLLDQSCRHYRKGSDEEGQDQDWTSNFWAEAQCDCLNRFIRHFESGKIWCPDDLVTVFIPVNLYGFVEYRFVDPENGVAEWTYFIPYRFSSRTGI